VDARIGRLREKIFYTQEYTEAIEAFPGVRETLKDLENERTRAIRDYRDAIREIREDNAPKFESHANLQESAFEEVQSSREAVLNDWEELDGELEREQSDDGPTPASRKECEDDPTRYRKNAEALLQRLRGIQSDETARANGVAGREALGEVGRHLDARDAGEARDRARAAVLALQDAGAWAGTALDEAKRYKRWLEEAEDLPSAPSLGDAVRNWVGGVPDRFAPGSILLLIRRKTGSESGDPYRFDADLAKALEAPFPGASAWRIAEGLDAPVYRMTVEVDPTGKAKFPTVLVRMETVAGELVVKKEWRLWPSKDTDRAIPATSRRSAPRPEDPATVEARRRWGELLKWKSVQRNKAGQPVLHEKWDLLARRIAGNRRVIRITKFVDLGKGLARLTVTARARPDGRADTCEMILIPGSGTQQPFLIDREELTVERAQRFLRRQGKNPANTITEFFKDGRRGWQPKVGLRLLQGLSANNAGKFAEISGKELPQLEEWRYAKQLSDGLPPNAAVLNLHGGVSE